MIKTIFGTDGIRTAMGSYPLTITDLTKLGYAIGAWACEYYGHAPAILLAHDTRESAAFMKSALQAGLLLHGATIYDCHIATTPTVCQQVHYNQLFDMGIIISASHNPYHDNGIKIIDGRSGKLSPIEEHKISSLFLQVDLSTITYNNFGTTVAWQPEQNYGDTIENLFDKNFLLGKKIVLDCAHGATFELAPKLFSKFGAQVIAINDSPNGKNINDDCGALHLKSLQQAVIERHADIGFAFDGDGDRVIAVNRHGEIKNGDDILAVLLGHPAYQQEAHVVGTIMTNQGFAGYLKKHDKNLVRVAVGDKHIAEYLEKNCLLIGGEQSGHIILRDYLATGDGIFTALRTCQALEFANNWAMITFEKYPQIIINVPITHKKDLSLPPFSNLIEEFESKLQGGRLIVRYSGTESLLRVMVEDENFDHAHYVGNNLCLALQQELAT